MTLEQRFHLPHISTFNGPHCIFELQTNYNSYLPAPPISYLFRRSLCRPQGELFYHFSKPYFLWSCYSDWITQYDISLGCFTELFTTSKYCFNNCKQLCKTPPQIWYISCCV